jgi:hypothetical protein
MTVLSQVNRLHSRVQEPPQPDFALPPYGDIAFEFAPFGLEISEGPYPSPLGMEFAAFGIKFDVIPGQAEWGMEFAPFGLEIGAGQEAWGMEFAPFGLVIGAGLGTPADTTEWGMEFAPFGLFIDPPWGMEFAPFGLQIEPATVPTRTVTYCWNLRSEPPQCTKWTNWPLVHITRVNGTNYAYHNGVMYVIGGESDDGQPINSSVTLTPFAGGRNAEGKLMRSRLPFLYAGLNTDAATIYALIDETGSEDYIESPPYGFTKGRGNMRRAQLGRGLSSGLWGFRIENKNGERLKIIEFEFPFQLTSRGI